MRNIDRIKKLIKGRKVIAYGSGVTALVFLTEARLENVEVAYVCDGNKKKQGRKLLEKDIRSPYDLIYEDKDKTVIVICTPGGKDIVMERLYGMGFTDENILMYFSAKNDADHTDALLGASRGDNTIVDMAPDSDARRKILILGGSTSDPTYEGIRSWSWYLQKKFNENGQEVKVLNGAVVGHATGQELLCLLRDGIREKPDAVISYTGYNDYSEAMDLPSGGHFPLINKNLYDYHEKMIKSYTENNEDELRPMYYGKETNDAFSEFIYNARSMNALCGEFGIRYYHIFQPIITGELIPKGSFAENLIKEDAIKKCIERFEDFHDQYKKVRTEYPYMYDFTDIFEQEEDIFHDTCHVSEKGNEMIAGRVYELLSDQGW
ncbi:MAG: hypothetical protein IJT96_02145 [Lachnospiraceae bacterium]|nr:hypothetical protein [Lachnospiraceae bacterium]